MDKKTTNPSRATSGRPSEALAAAQAKRHTEAAQTEWNRAKRDVAAAVDAVAREGKETLTDAERQAKKIGQEIRTAAEGAVDEAKTQTSGLLEARKRRVASGVDGIQAALEDAASRLREAQNGNLAEYTAAAARGVKEVSTYLHERSLAGVVEDVENIARRRPELVFGGLAVAGLAAGRFIKSSSERHQGLPDGEQWVDVEHIESDRSEVRHTPRVYQPSAGPEIGRGRR